MQSCNQKVHSPIFKNFWRREEGVPRQENKLKVCLFMCAGLCFQVFVDACMLGVPRQDNKLKVCLFMCAGLCFQGFVDACMEISRRKFTSLSASKMLETLVSYCEDNMRGIHTSSSGLKMDEDSEKRERISPRVLRQQHRSVTMFPRRTITSLEEETVHDLFKTAMMKRERSLVSEVNNFMRDMRHRTYVPSALTGLNREGPDDFEWDELRWEEVTMGRRHQRVDRPWME